MKIKLTKEEFEKVLNEANRQSLTDLDDEIKGQISDKVFESVREIVIKEQKGFHDTLLKCFNEQQNVLEIDERAKRFSEWANYQIATRNITLEIPDFYQSLIDDMFNTTLSADSVNNIPSVKVLYPNRYTTSNTRAEKKLFLDSNFHIADFTDTEMTIAKSEKDSTPAYTLLIKFNDSESMDFMEDNRQLFALVLSAVYGIIFDPCKTLYESELKGSESKSVFSKGHPIITMQQLYVYLTQNKKARFSDASESTQKLLLKVIDILQNTNVTTTHTSGGETKIYSSSFLPCKTETRIINGQINRFTLVVYDMPPLLREAIINKHVMSVPINPPPEKGGRRSSRSLEMLIINDALRRWIYSMNPIREARPVIQISLSTIKNDYLPKDYTGRNKTSVLYERVSAEFDHLKEEGLFYECKPDTHADDKSDTVFHVHFFDPIKEAEYLRNIENKKQIREEAKLTEQGKLSARKNSAKKKK